MVFLKLCKYLFCVSPLPFLLWKPLVFGRQLERNGGRSSCFRLVWYRQFVWPGSSSVPVWSSLTPCWSLVPLSSLTPLTPPHMVSYTWFLATLSRHLPVGWHTVTILAKLTKNLTCRWLLAWRISFTADLLLFAAEFQFLEFQFLMGSAALQTSSSLSSSSSPSSSSFEN